MINRWKCYLLEVKLSLPKRNYTWNKTWRLEITSLVVATSIVSSLPEVSRKKVVLKSFPNLPGKNLLWCPLLRPGLRLLYLWKDLPYTNSNNTFCYHSSLIYKICIQEKVLKCPYIVHHKLITQVGGSISLIQNHWNIRKEQFSLSVNIYVLEQIIVTINAYLEPCQTASDEAFCKNN